MRTCPHCEASIASHAVQCPECRQWVAERRPGASDIIGTDVVADWPGVTPDPTPDYRGYLWLGACLVALGFLIAVTGGNGAAAVASVPFLVGGVLLLIGIVGCGVYIGLRQHTEWLESRQQ